MPLNPLLYAIDDDLALLVAPDPDFADPQQPPPRDMQQAGRYRSEEAVFVQLVTPSPNRVLPFLPDLLRRLGSTFMRTLGMQLYRQDSRLARRWAPLAAATLANRRRKGRRDSFPYSPQFAQDVMANKWGVDTAMDQGGGSIAFGWRGTHEGTSVGGAGNALRDAESGTGAQKVGRGRQVEISAQRPLGATEEVAAALTQEVGRWAKEQSQAFVPDAIAAPAPLWADL